MCLNIYGWICAGTHKEVTTTFSGNIKVCQTYLADAQSHVDRVKMDIKVEDEHFSTGMKTLKLDPIDLVAVVKVENEVPSEDETDETDEYQQTGSLTFGCGKQESKISTASMESTIDGKKANTKQEDVLWSIRHEELSLKSFDAAAVEKPSDGTNRTGDLAVVIGKNHQRGVKTKRVDMNLTDVSSSVEFTSSYISMSPHAECSLLIKKEEDIDADDETVQGIIESNFRPSVDEDEHFKCDDKLYQPKTLCNQEKEISVWELGDKDCSDLSSVAVSKPSSKLRNASHGFKLEQVSVVLEDLKFKPSRIVQQCFLCPICHTKFSLSSHLKRHLKAHTNRKSFSCTDCPAKFSRKDNFTHHLNIHFDEKPFSCEKPFLCTYCRATFKRSDYLQSHLKTHTSDKPYKCGQCQANFKQKRYLRDHLTTHTNKKPFQCRLCLAKFSRKMGLERHLRRHTNEKPFSCHFCLGKFTRKDALKSHLKTHADKIQYSCAHCPAKFNRKDFLKAHLSNLHDPAKSKLISGSTTYLEIYSHHS